MASASTDAKDDEEDDGMVCSNGQNGIWTRREQRLYGVQGAAVRWLSPAAYINEMESIDDDDDDTDHDDDQDGDEDEGGNEDEDEDVGEDGDEDKDEDGDDARDSGSNSDTDVDDEDAMLALAIATSEASALAADTSAAMRHSLARPSALISYPDDGYALARYESARQNAADSDDDMQAAIEASLSYAGLDARMDAQLQAALDASLYPTSARVYRHGADPTACQVTKKRLDDLARGRAPPTSSSSSSSSSSCIMPIRTTLDESWMLDTGYEPNPIRAPAHGVNFGAVARPRPHDRGTIGGVPVRAAVRDPDSDTELDCSSNKAGRSRFGPNAAHGMSSAFDSASSHIHGHGSSSSHGPGYGSSQGPGYGPSYGPSSSAGSSSSWLDSRYDPSSTSSSSNQLHQFAPYGSRVNYGPAETSEAELMLSSLSLNAENDMDEATRLFTQLHTSVAVEDTTEQDMQANVDRLARLVQKCTRTLSHEDGLSAARRELALNEAYVLSGPPDTRAAAVAAGDKLRTLLQVSQQRVALNLMVLTEGTALLDVAKAKLARFRAGHAD